LKSPSKESWIRSTGGWTPESNQFILGWCAPVCEVWWRSLLWPVQFKQWNTQTDAADKRASRNSQFLQVQQIGFVTLGPLRHA